MEDKSDFKVKLGEPVQLQFIPDDRERLNARIIGHAPHKSLIISAPQTGSGKLPILRENQRFIVRMLIGSRMMGFESEVLKYYTMPYPHVHLRHPEEIETITVRNSRRVDTNLVISAQLQNSNETCSATLLNTSSSGALIKSSESLGDIGDRLTLSMELPISDLKKYLRLGAVIRNLVGTEPASNQSNSEFRYGVQFADLSDDQRLMLNAYVNEQAVKQLEE